MNTALHQKAIINCYVKCHRGRTSSQAKLFTWTLSNKNNNYGGSDNYIFSKTQTLNQNSLSSLRQNKNWQKNHFFSEETEYYEEKCETKYLWQSKQESILKEYCDSFQMNWFWFHVSRHPTEKLHCSMGICYTLFLNTHKHDAHGTIWEPQE